MVVVVVVAAAAAAVADEVVVEAYLVPCLEGTQRSLVEASGHVEYLVGLVVRPVTGQVFLACRDSPVEACLVEEPFQEETCLVVEVLGIGTCAEGVEVHLGSLVVGPYLG